MNLVQHMRSMAPKPMLNLCRIVGHDLVYLMLVLNLIQFIYMLLVCCIYSLYILGLGHEKLNI